MNITPSQLMKTNRRAIGHVLPGTCLALVFTLLCAGCIRHWPDAPFMERAEALSQKNHNLLVADFPKATLVGGVYRTHMENKRGKYKVTHSQFLFLNEDGQLHHGTIDRNERFTGLKAAYAEKLPDELTHKLFTAPGALFPNAIPDSKVWTYNENDMLIYQFEFNQGERAGLCTIDTNDTRRSIFFFTEKSP